MALHRLVKGHRRSVQHFRGPTRLVSVARQPHPDAQRAALLSRVKKIFFAHGYVFVYGQIRADRPGLDAFYRRQGFEVREPDEGLDLWVVFGIRGGIHPDQGERFLVRARPRNE